MDDNNISEEISKADTPELFENIKYKLFMENVRLQTQKSQLESDFEQLSRERKSVMSERKQLQREKSQLKIEIGELRDEVEYERKRLKEDELLLERKQKIIEHSYELLDKDKAQIQSELARIELEKEKITRMRSSLHQEKEVYATGLFFRGVSNPAALKKRYKDLMKIYHPDNESGDSDIILKINQEYSDLKRKFDI